MDLLLLERKHAKPSEVQKLSWKLLAKFKIKTPLCDYRITYFVIYLFEFEKYTKGCLYFINNVCKSQLPYQMAI